MTGRRTARCSGRMRTHVLLRCVNPGRAGYIPGRPRASFSAAAPSPTEPDRPPRFCVRAPKDVIETVKSRTTLATAALAGVFAVPAGAKAPSHPLLRPTLAGQTVGAQLRNAAHHALVRRDARLAHAVKRLGGDAPSRHALALKSNRSLRRLQTRLIREEHDLKVAAQAPPVSGALQAIAACESGGDPHAIGGGGAFRGKYQFTYAHLGRVGGSGDPAAAPEAEQDRRAAMLYASRGRGPVARLRPLTPLGAAPQSRDCPHSRPPGMDPAELRARVPRSARDQAYLNAGTCGPLPDAAVRAAAGVGREAAERGRARPTSLRALSRSAPATARGLRRARCAPSREDVALTTCDERGHGARCSPAWTSRRGDEIVTARRRAPRPARPADRRPRAAGVDGARRPAGGPRRRRRPGDAAGRLLARRAGSPAPWRRPSSPSSTSPCCSTAPRASAQSPSTSRRSAATFYAGSGPEVAVRARRAPACSGSRPALARAPRAARARLRQPRRARRGPGRRALAGRARATTRRRWRSSRSRPRSPPTTCSRSSAGRRSTSAPRRSLRPLADRLRERGRDRRPARAHDARVLGEPRLRRAAAAGSPSRASSCATCPARSFVRASVGAWNDESDLERLLAAI